MAKIAQISSKYIVHASITIDGLVDRPDVIGAIFGQTEGLLGNDLELRELQRSGRIGRIEVNVVAKQGKSSGEIIIPSSLDKAETAIVAAALEIIQRIGPCNAKIRTEQIEDIRISKRQYVIERAKELLKTLMDDVMPDSQELADEVSQSVRVMEIQEWGRDKLAAGPSIDDSDEIILVEGRADVLTLLKHGFKNVISMNGTSIPDSIKELCRQKNVTVFVDGDRGGDVIIKELIETTEIDYVTKAPDGKEVEELAKKEIHKSLRARIAAEQYKLDYKGSVSVINNRRNKTEHELQDQLNEMHELRNTPQQRGDEERPQHDDRPRPQERAPMQRDNRQQERPQMQRQPMQRDDRQQERPLQRQPMQRDDRQQERPLQRQPMQRDGGQQERAPMQREERQERAPREEKKADMTPQIKEQLGKLLEDLLGTHGAFVLDQNLKILGKVPGTELVGTIRALKTGMFAIVFDGAANQELISTCEATNIAYVACMNSTAKGTKTKVLTAEELL